MRYKTIRKPWLEFVAQLFLNRMSVQSYIGLKIDIACTNLNRLSENRCEIKDVAIVKASYHVGMKMAKISLQKRLQIKTNLDNATDFLKYKASIIWSVMQVQILLLFLLH